MRAEAKKLVGIVGADADHAGDQGQDRAGVARRRSDRDGSDRRRRPPARRDRVRRLRRLVANRAASARIRRVRKRDRRADPRPFPENRDSERGQPMTNEEIRNALQKAIGEEQVMLFMKGTPDAPRCGFSARTVAMLDALGVEYAALDILPDARIREELSAIS